MTDEPARDRSDIHSATNHVNWCRERAPGNCGHPVAKCGHGAETVNQPCIPPTENAIGNLPKPPAGAHVPAAGVVICPRNRYSTGQSEQRRASMCWPLVRIHDVGTWIYERRDGGSLTIVTA